ncbi:MAG: hypothetical protein ACI8WT_003136 [Clostridium sp.]|jgi:hypothetical protein
MKSIILLIFIYVSNAFSAVLLASDVDPSGVLLSLSLLSMMVLSILIAQLGYRKVLSIIGK